MKILKYSGYVISLIGILIGLGNLLGWFESKERIDFYNIVIDSNKTIPINHPALREFISDFPPPPNFKNVQLNKTVMNTSSGFTMDGFLRYTNLETKEEKGFATFDEVKAWSRKTNAGWLSLIIVCIGWIISVANEIVLKYKR